MSKFIKVNKGFTSDTNFWDLNPQIANMLPFNNLYKRDKTKNKSKSSQEMWCVFFMCDPDEDENKFYRISKEERKGMLKATYFPGIDWDEKLLNECMDKYPFLCMSSIERAYAEEKESIISRSSFIRKYEREIANENLLLMEKEVFNQVINLRKLLETMRKNTESIYNQLDKVEEKFMKNKSNTRVKGGRRQSKSEKKLL